MWSNWSDPEWLSRTKAAHKLEDLLLSFIAAVLKMAEKDPEINTQNKHLELHRQLDTFVDLLDDIAGSLGSAGSLVASRLKSLKSSAGSVEETMRDDVETSQEWPGLWQDVEELFGKAPAGLTERLALQVGPAVGSPDDCL